MRESYDIVGSYNNQRRTDIDSERTINLFEYLDPKGKKDKVLLPTSGLLNSGAEFTGETLGIRATFVFNTNLYAVVGAGVFLLDSSLNVSLLGTLTTSSGYVGVDANTYQIIFVDGAKGYIWDTIALTFTEITDTSFPTKPIDVCYLDGFFVVANGDTNNFQLSGFNQGLIWGPASDTFTADDATDQLTLASTNNYPTGVPVTFSTTGALPAPLSTVETYYVIKVSSTLIKVATSYENAIIGTAINLTTTGSGTNTITNGGELQLGSINSHPGTIVACRTLHRRLFLFSQNYTEIWYNAGIGANLPFRRDNSALMEVGTPAIGSVSVGFDRMFFLSQDRDGLGPVMMVVGTQALPISNRALDFALAQYAGEPATLGVADARGIVVKENGILFYRLNFTQANHTYVYNVSMSDQANPRWHEEEVLNGDRHPAQTHAYFNGVNYYGSYISPILYIVDSSFNSNDGQRIKRTRIGRPIVDPKYNRLRIDRFQLDISQGEFDSIFAYLSPVIYLSISKDGGQTYGNKLSAPVGRLGQRTFRTVWRKLGTIPRGQPFVPKIEFYELIPLTILGAAWDFEVMPE